MRKGKISLFITMIVQSLLLSMCMRLGSERSRCKYNARYENFSIRSELQNCSLALVMKSANHDSLNIESQTEWNKFLNLIMLDCLKYYQTMKECESKSTLKPDVYGAP